VGVEPPHDGQHELALAADTIAELKLPPATRGKSS
jgi:hypothetical protein